MLARTYRFRGKDALKPLFRRGQRQRGDNFQMRFMATQRKNNRFAVIVSKKVAKRAVVRNRIRRRIYTVLETYARSTPVHDVAIIVYDSDFTSIKRSELEQRIADALKPVFN